MFALVPTNTVITHWVCNECSQSTDWPLSMIPDNGAPICGDCGDDMELQPNVSINV